MKIVQDYSDWAFCDLQVGGLEGGGGGGVRGGYTLLRNVKDNTSLPIKHEDHSTPPNRPSKDK